MTWVPWTLNPLNSAKSPWVVYQSNYRLPVHPLLNILVGGSSSCCSCDRGKTKSTPSRRMEVWTLDIGLEFDKKAKKKNWILEMGLTPHWKEDILIANFSASSLSPRFRPKRNTLMLFDQSPSSSPHPTFEGVQGLASPKYVQCPSHPNIQETLFCM